MIYQVYRIKKKGVNRTVNGSVGQPSYPDGIFQGELDVDSV